MRNLLTDKVAMFKSNQWFSKTHEDGLLVREIPAEIEGKKIIEGSSLFMLSLKFLVSSLHVCCWPEHVYSLHSDFDTSDYISSLFFVSPSLGSSPCVCIILIMIDHLLLLLLLAFFPLKWSHRCELVSSTASCPGRPLCLPQQLSGCP